MTEWLLTTEDMSDILGLTPRQVLREVEHGRLRCDLPVKLPSGKVRRRFTIQNVVDYVKDWCKEGNADAVLAAARSKLAA